MQYNLPIHYFYELWDSCLRYISDLLDENNIIASYNLQIDHGQVIKWVGLHLHHRTASVYGFGTMEGA